MSAAPLSPAPVQRGWLLAVLCAIPLGMLLLALFAFKPLYGLWCRATGTGMGPAAPLASGVAAAAVAPGGRTVEVFFEAKTYDGLPVRFRPDQASLTVAVGADGLNTYHFKNLSDHRVRFRPIHSVSPLAASRSFGMKICFCFNDQTIEPGETKDFPVLFTFKPDLDERIASVTVRYSLFAITDGADQSLEQQRIQQQVEGAGAIVTPGFAPSAPASAPVPAGAP
jgi:cytochrome c oxidase assembly protein subunit 11